MLGPTVVDPQAPLAGPGRIDSRVDPRVRTLAGAHRKPVPTTGPDKGDLGSPKGGPRGW